MEIRATARYVRTSPRKLRPIAGVVRGKKVEEALTILKFLPSPSARTVARVVKSAAANAENNFEMTPSDLRIVKIYIDGGRSMKRYRAGPRGRAKPILKRSSHITVVVKEEE
ncbi:MAG: 50S ribosomal protein L22 [Dehalococcoidia bacterium DG_18]|nr:MAG: 50S ribosomal protein L22 [Dehalococcoidia bacterium DG_18]